MDQAKNFVCRSCSTAGAAWGTSSAVAAAPPSRPRSSNARTQFFGQLQAPGKAKLILIRGEGVEGLSYQLNAEQHIVGRNGQLVFPDDPFVSPKHANFFYRNGKLVVRDEGSLNGVYLRVRGTVDIAPGDTFLAGEQLFRLDATPKVERRPGARRHVLLLVAEAPEPVPHHADPPGRRVRHDRLRARRRRCRSAARAAI